MTGPSGKPSTACRIIRIDSRNSSIRIKYRSYVSPCVPSGTSKSNSEYAAFGSSLRKSLETPDPRSGGPHKPRLVASSPEITPTFLVRCSQIRLLVRSVSYSLSLPSIRSQNDNTLVSQPGGISSGSPPTRIELYVSRAPQNSSNKSSTNSRSRNAYNRTVIAPISIACVPNQRQ